MNTKKQNIELHYDLSLSIDIPNGNVKICKSNDQTAYLTTDNPAQQDDLFSAISVKISDKNYVSLDNSYYQKISLNVHLPEGKVKDIAITINNGNILIDDYNAAFTLQVNNGDIKINKCSGKITAACLNGGIKIQNFTGEAGFTANNGSIKIFEWNEARGEITNNNGQVVIGLISISDTVTTHANNGKITLGVPENNGCTIIARGKSVYKYIDDITRPDDIGSPVTFDWEGGGKKLELFSKNNIIRITRLKNLSDIIPDFENIFSEFENAFNINIDIITENFKELGKRFEKWGSEFAHTIQSAFMENMDNRENKNRPGQTSTESHSDDKPDEYKNEKMEVITLLKEGKITAEEAEKLLNALK